MHDFFFTKVYFHHDIHSIHMEMKMVLMLLLLKLSSSDNLFIEISSFLTLKQHKY